MAKITMKVSVSMRETFPCLVINDNNVTFGKKNINQVLDLIKQ